jgi:PAS domain S-box-containing protein
MKDEGVTEELRTLRRRADEIEALEGKLRLAEATLEKEIRFRETLVWNLPVLFMTIGRDGKTIMMNRKALSTLGYSPQQVGGRDFCSTLVSIKQQHTVQAILRSIQRTEEPTVYEALIVAEDGSEVPVEWHAMALTGEAGEVEMIFQVGLDKGAEHEHDARLRHAESLSALGKLTSGIAHDFNNLLLAIQGNVSLMLLDIEELVDEQVRSGATMTRKLLEYAGDSRRNVMVLSLNALIEENAHAFGRAKKEITIEQDLAPDLLPVTGDARSIDQVLLDLFVTAASSMPSGGKLSILTRNVLATEINSSSWKPVQDSYVMVRVVDDGEAHDQEALQLMFAPAEHLDDSGRGRGLGLSAAQRIVNESGGYMEAESDPCQGNTVTVYLPAFKESSASGQPLDRAVREGASILLVDDEKIVLNVGGRLLRKLGYTVTEAASGKDAVTIYRNNPDAFDLVILDIVMPEMNGGEVFERLKRIDPDVKVFLATGYSVDGQATEMLRKGACGFVQKPFSMNTLAENIDRVLSE